MEKNESIRLLYVEDDPLDYKLTLAHLAENASELNVTHAESGNQCLKLLKNENFDIILLDNNLRDTTGLKVLQEIIRQNVITPVILITGLGDEKLVVKAMKTGAVDYVAKHGNYLEELPKILKRVYEQSHNRSLTQITLKEGSLNVLYIDHNKADLELTLIHFAKEAPNIQITPVTSFNRALDELKRKDYDLILSDLRMPQSSGLDFVRNAQFLGITTPIIIITSKGDEETAVTLLKLGVYDYVVKHENYLDQLSYVIQNAILRKHREKMKQHMELEFRRSNAELEQAYKELEAFSYSVSHDLRSPLRAIDGFTAILNDTYSDILPQEGKDLIRSVRENVKIMSRLIQSLLDLSRVGRKQVDKSDVDFNQMLKDMTPEIKKLMPEHPIEIKVQKLPVVKCDIGLMRQVWINLLSNAVKFSKNRPEIIIDVRCRESETEWIYSVKDNGVGFDSANATKLFGVFQRFHSVKDFEGDGIGLALVSKIISKHSGRVWAESEPDNGASFFFALPKQE